MRYTRRRTHRADANSAEIIKAARKLGIECFHIGRPVDWLVGIGGTWYPLETKAPKGGYTDDQMEFRARCEEKKLPMLTWRSVEDMRAQLSREANW